MHIKFLFNKKEKKLDYYRERDFLDELCKRLKEHAAKIISYKEKNDTAN